MLSKREAYNLYSVFVGHLSQSVTKADLLELFSGCGEVEDVFMCDGCPSPYLFGFVRFREVESVYKAVKTLHRWPLKGNKIVVDIAKDTGDRIKKEGEVKVNIDKLSSSPSPSAPLLRDRPHTGTQSSLIQDVVQLGRLKESYASLSVEAKRQTATFSGHKSLSVADIETFMGDVEQSNGMKSKCYEGEIHSSVTPESVYQALLNSDDMDPAFGMKRSNQFLSALKVVMGNMASFLKDHELLSAEAGEMFDLCTGEGQNEEGEGQKHEEGSSSGSSSSHDRRKVYRDSGFESELETKPREQKSLETELSPVFDDLPSCNQDGVKPGQLFYPHPEKKTIQSQSSKCSSSEFECIEDLKLFEDDTQSIGERSFDQVLEESGQSMFKSCGEQILVKQESKEKVREIVNPRMIGVELKDESIQLKENSNKPCDVSELNNPVVNQAVIPVEEENKLSSVSSLSTSTSSSQSTKLQRSNYYRPLSPVLPDLSIRSSALHSKPSKPDSSVEYSTTVSVCNPKSAHITCIDPIGDRSPNASSSHVTESFYVDASPITSSSPVTKHFYAEESPTSILLNERHELSSPSVPNQHLDSAPPVNDWVLKTGSPEISVNQDNRDILANTSIPRPVFHKSISDSCVSNLQKFTQSTPDDGSSSRTSRSPGLEGFQKLDLEELFVSCKGKMQGVATEKLCLTEMFRTCNGKKLEMPIEHQLCPAVKKAASQKTLPKGVSFEECQRNLDTVKLGWGRGLDSLRKTWK